MPRHRISAEQRRFARALRRAQTSLEARIWHELRGKRLDGWKFKRQVPIERYVVDFVCLEARLIVELDGPLHSEPGQKAKDLRRDAVLNVHGFTLLRFTDETALGQVIEDIRRALPTPNPGST